MQAESSKTQNRTMLIEALALAADFMILLIVKANMPIDKFVLGALYGMWITCVMAYAGAVLKTYVWKRR